MIQSSLPTTIYVQNLSFFVSQISTSHTFFFYLADVHDIYGDTDEVWNFLTPTKKRVKKKGKKRVKKRVKFEIL